MKKIIAIVLCLQLLTSCANPQAEKDNELITSTNSSKETSTTKKEEATYSALDYSKAALNYANSKFQTCYNLANADGKITKNELIDIADEMKNLNEAIISENKERHFSIETYLIGNPNSQELLNELTKLQNQMLSKLETYGSDIQTAKDDLQRNSEESEEYKTASNKLKSIMDMQQRLINAGKEENETKTNLSTTGTKATTETQTTKPTSTTTRTTASTTRTAATAPTPTQTPKQTATTNNLFNETTVKSQLVVKKYTYNSGNSHFALLAITNNSKFDLNITADITCIKSDGTMVGASKRSEPAVQSGTTILLYSMPDEAYSDIKYDISVKEEKNYKSVNKNLSYKSTAAKNKEIISVTNKGTEPVEYAEGYVLFFKGNKVVGFGSRYFTDDDNELKSGETEIREINCYEPYDSFKVYLTGRGER
jgi:hypothetical protein